MLLIIGDIGSEVSSVHFTHSSATNFQGQNSAMGFDNMPRLPQAPKLNSFVFVLSRVGDIQTWVCSAVLRFVETFG